MLLLSNRARCALVQPDYASWNPYCGKKLSSGGLCWCGEWQRRRQNCRFACSLRGWEGGRRRDECLLSFVQIPSLLSCVQQGWDGRLTSSNCEFQPLVAVTDAHTENVLGLQVYRQQDNWRVGSGQPCWHRGLADNAGHLAHADIECEVWIVLLSHANGIIQRGGDVRLAAQQNRTEVLHLRRLLREAE